MTLFLLLTAFDGLLLQFVILAILSVGGINDD